MDNLDVMQLALKETTPGWHRKNARGSILDEKDDSVAFNGRGGSDKEWIDQGEANVTHILNCSPANVQVFLDIIKEQEEALKGLLDLVQTVGGTESVAYAEADAACENIKKWVGQLKVSCPAKLGVGGGG